MKHIPFILTLALILASCSGRNAQNLYDEARAAEDSGKFTVAAEKYEQVVRDYPTEAVAETSLYKVITIRSNSAGDRTPAVDAQRRFLELYPKSAWAPNVTFMLAFNYNNELAQYDSAKKYYQLFLEKYPGHELAASAKFELETIGKEPEHILTGGSQGAPDVGNPPPPGKTQAKKTPAKKIPAKKTPDAGTSN
jgi:outer membrane protein assembly factor BamD (BamD/ComL family)